MLIVFGATLFLSAALLFMVQPMVARQILPLLGGSPSVWNTCMVFYQAMLLLGYLYAHALGRRPPRVQAGVHAAALLVPLAVLPIRVPEGWSSGAFASPTLAVLALLGAIAAIPFLVVSTTAPLVQRWFSLTDHPAARDPYFLYAASNAGSLVGLVGYPLLVEPLLGVREQARAWAFGYGACAALALVCAAVMLARPRRAGAPGEAGPRAAPAPAPPDDPAASRPRRRESLRRARWVLLAAVPSSLTLGVTQYFSNNLTSAPMMWVPPLAIYLLSYIIAFSRRPVLSVGLSARIFPMAIVAVVVSIMLDATHPISTLLALHWLALLLAGTMCHGLLAQDRPEPARLTEFYLMLAVGGVLGGAFNALLAPVVFTSIVEYPVALIAACLLRPAAPRPAGAPRRWADARGHDLAWPLVLAAVLAGIVVWLDSKDMLFDPRYRDMSKILVVGVPAVGLALCIPWARRFALAAAALLLAAQIVPRSFGELLHASRTFFGVHRVYEDREGIWHTLIHGNTIHGLQSTVEPMRYRPTSFYFPTGPIGDVFRTFWDDPRLDRIGAVGLGSGTLAAYGKPARDFTFFEIDPQVERIARDPALFTYIADSPSSVRVVLGDARLTLADQPDGAFGLLMIDAFSSDAIPVHLVTLEAVRLYITKVEPRGLLALHISNRYIDLAPVLASHSDELGLVGLIRDDSEITPAEDEAGKLPATWVVLARDPADLGPLATDRNWTDLDMCPGRLRWTDDYANLLAAWRRRGH